DGEDLFLVGQSRKVEAARDGLAIDQHGAAAAQPLPATLARAVQAERLPQHLDQALVRRDLRLDRFAIQPEADRAPHFSFCIALNTASAVIGSEVSRTPTASWIALAMAGETPKVAVSPTPLAPNGPLCWTAV